MGKIPNLLAARSDFRINPNSAEAVLDKQAPSRYNRWTEIAFSDFVESIRMQWSQNWTLEPLVALHPVVLSFGGIR
jgi:hypothetical protein